MYLGEIKIGNDLTFYCNTHTPSTGAAVDADAVPAYEIYEDETGTAVASGNMALLNDAGTTGFYSEQVTLAAATYEAGKSYTIRITGVVGGVTGVELHQFTCAARATDDLAFPVVSGRGLDVTATGAAGVDWANVENPTTTVGLSGTTVKAVTDGVGLANDAITSAKFDESTAFPLKAADSGSTYLARTGADSDTLKTLSDQVDGVEPADVWAYATRTLTATAASTVSAISGSTLTLTQYADYAATLSGLTISATWTKIYLTIKADEADTDAQALVKLVVTNPAALTDGLLYLEGAAYTTAAHGSLTVNQAAGTIAIALTADATEGLAKRQDAAYDVKQVTAAGGVTILTSGACTIVSTETRSIT